MKKNERYFLYAAAAAVGLLIFRKVRALGNLVFTPGQVTNMQMLNGLPVIEFSIMAQNTSSAGVTIDSFAGNLYTQGTLIGNIYNFSPVNIPGNSMVPILVSVQLAPVGLVNELMRAFQFSNFTQDLQVNGFANVSGIQVPINIKFSAGAGN